MGLIGNTRGSALGFQVPLRPELPSHLSTTAQEGAAVQQQLPCMASSTPHRHCLMSQCPWGMVSPGDSHPSRAELCPEDTVAGRQGDTEDGTSAQGKDTDWRRKGVLRSWQQ